MAERLELAVGLHRTLLVLVFGEATLKERRFLLEFAPFIVGGLERELRGVQCGGGCRQPGVRGLHETGVRGDVPPSFGGVSVGLLKSDESFQIRDHALS